MTSDGSGNSGAETVAIIGLGASGEAAARLALESGGEVYVSDLRADAQARACGDELQALGADVELGGHDVARIAESATVVVSPGIPPDASVLVDLRNHGRGWISEPEFAFRFFRSALIAVTGTNGKTTTAALLAHVLESSGTSVGLGGNIGAGLGPPASTLALLDPPPDWIVLEVSSFQLADVDTFAPDIGIVTSLAPDHMDRYADVDAYYGDKARMFDNAGPDSRWVLDRDSEPMEALIDDAPGLRYWFSTREEVERGGWLDGDALTVRLGEEPRTVLRASELPLLGRHNVSNALAAAVAAELAGASPDDTARGLRSFEPLPHRLEPVAEIGGVLWINDSKATNVAAARSALTSLDRPVVILLGGKDKGEDLAPLADAVEGRARVAVCYGQAGPRIAGALEARTEVVLESGSFGDAVRRARSLTRPGDALLLSPACSSFDMFESYEERGDRFVALARREA